MKFGKRIIEVLPSGRVDVLRFSEILCICMPSNIRLSRKTFYLPPGKTYRIQNAPLTRATTVICYVGYMRFLLILILL